MSVTGVLLAIAGVVVFAVGVAVMLDGGRTRGEPATDDEPDTGRAT